MILKPVGLLGSELLFFDSFTDVNQTALASHVPEKSIDGWTKTLTTGIWIDTNSPGGGSAAALGNDAQYRTTTAVSYGRIEANGIIPNTINAYILLAIGTNSSRVGGATLHLIKGNAPLMYLPSGPTITGTGTIPLGSYFDIEFEVTPSAARFYLNGDLRINTDISAFTFTDTYMFLQLSKVTTGVEYLKLWRQ